MICAQTVEEDPADAVLQGHGLVGEPHGQLRRLTEEKVETGQVAHLRLFLQLPPPVPLLDEFQTQCGRVQHLTFPVRMIGSDRRVAGHQTAANAMDLDQRFVFHVFVRVLRVQEVAQVRIQRVPDQFQGQRSMITIENQLFLT